MKVPIRMTSNFGKLAAAIVLFLSGILLGKDNDYYPTAESKGGWRTLANDDELQSLAAVDPKKLAELKAWLLKSDERDFAAVVVRNGYIVLEVERGNSAKTDARRVASVSKAIIATVLAIASEQSQQGLTPHRMKFEDLAFDFIPWASLAKVKTTNVDFSCLNDWKNTSSAISLHVYYLGARFNWYSQVGKATTNSTSIQQWNAQTKVRNSMLGVTLKLLDPQQSLAAKQTIFDQLIQQRVGEDVKQLLQYLDIWAHGSLVQCFSEIHMLFPIWGKVLFAALHRVTMTCFERLLFNGQPSTELLREYCKI